MKIQHISSYNGIKDGKESVAISNLFLRSLTSTKDKNKIYIDSL